MSEGSFFSSRWIPCPENVSEASDGGLPKGFRAAGGACGVKADGARDVALIVSDAPETTSAARFSRSGAQSAPVLYSRQESKLWAIRAVVVNSGNANAATGQRGIDDAAAMCAAAALAAGVDAHQVAVASTGVIGVPLPIARITSGIAALGSELRADGASDFAEAIRTTDAFSKQVTLDLALDAGTVRLSVQAKGAGMISPNFATLLVFVQTDAVLEADEADLLLSVCTKRSFDRISVDGQLSTSDTIVLQASGASGVRIEPKTADERLFGEALDAALRQVALLVARDGEGARRVGRVVVKGGDQHLCERVAHAIGDSPLVKTALYGGDPNWGRIIQAVGAALPVGVVGSNRFAPLHVDISIEDIVVCVNGSYVEHDERALAHAVKRDEVEYEVVLPGDGAEVERYFSDLGHEYVTINAEYTT
ncbi:MAG TPA: bifunctional glutamate N-acetyltransferase/amino-acid acetyltransferase ArgJ [Solirubrobacteraceae bacterium]|jgi:glutamate N-acetyltransferase/amino-acid N-acetyltransferase|nr:bifunctional glutamate N-acetyltransferase/amino-acid acetyltransferase ArgJ [Solirubrobacteraceae bacterium]